MDKDRKLNLYGAIIGVIASFGVIITTIILVNSLGCMRKIEDRGEHTLQAVGAMTFNDEYFIIYQEGDSEYRDKVQISEEEFEKFDKNQTPDISRHVYINDQGEYRYMENVKATKVDVLEGDNLPVKLPAIIFGVSLVAAIGGFLWCFYGTPTKTLKERKAEKQAKKESEEISE